MSQAGKPIIRSLDDVAVTIYENKKPNFLGGIEEAKIVPQGRLILGPGFRDVPVPIERTIKKGGLFGRSESIDHLGGRWLFGGPLWSHFGHFFTDCVHRLWPLIDSPNAFKGVVFLAVKGLENIQNDAQLEAAKPPPYLAELLELLGLSHVKVAYIKAPTVIEKMAVPPAGTGLHAPAAEFYRPYLKEFQKRIAEKCDPHIRRAPEKLYLGRSHLIKKGGILGSSYWEARLMENGFYSSTPEATRLAMQLGHIMGARTIVMDEGSAAHPTQVLDRLDARFFMFPRRTAPECPFEGMINARGTFRRLAERDNITTLPDRFGSTSSPAGLAVYNDPARVFDLMRAEGLVQGAFDVSAYEAAEMADVDSVQRAQTGSAVRRLAQHAGVSASQPPDYIPMLRALQQRRRVT